MYVLLYLMVSHNSLRFSLFSSFIFSLFFRLHNPYHIFTGSYSFDVEAPVEHLYSKILFRLFKFSTPEILLGSFL